MRAKQTLERLPEDTAISPSLRLVVPSMIREAKTEIRGNLIVLDRATGPNLLQYVVEAAKELNQAKKTCANYRGTH